MKTIGSMTELLSLQTDLTLFILTTCPWLAEQWEPENMGYVFVLDDQDVHAVKSIWPVPHIDEVDDNYRETMTIDLETFDLWEAPAYYDQDIGYWNAVAVLGQEYGCTLFLSSGFVASIPALHQRLNDIKQTR